jgi:hypothetical protein
MTMTGCKMLTLFADGELAGEDRRAFQLHLGRCRPCQDELETALMLDALGGTFGPGMNLDTARFLSGKGTGDHHHEATQGEESGAFRRAG